jgi:SAM-dependent methyltransferase
MAPPGALNDSIKQHYGRLHLGEMILGALENAGKDINRLKPEDLAPVDEFHIRGREATLELATAANLGSKTCVLDVGSGVGGPSRCIARHFGCPVTGIDLTDEYCRVAEMLAERVGLSDLVTYLQGDALDLRFPDDEFDVVWTQHTAMNVAEKLRFYQEMFRVLKHGGALAIYDILTGPTSSVHFPVPWARSQETSFLVTPEELRRLLENSGFTIVSWQDTTSLARAWLSSLAKRVREGGASPLGFHVLLGADFQAMARNQKLSFEEDGLVVAQVVARK